MAFKLPFTLPTLRPPQSAARRQRDGPPVERRSNRGKRLPLIGHLEIETQFRILGTVFLISLLIAIASVFMQARPPAAASPYLSVANQIAPLTQQIPRRQSMPRCRVRRKALPNCATPATVSATLETPGRRRRSQRGIKVSATSTQATARARRPARGLEQAERHHQPDLAQENRFLRSATWPGKPCKARAGDDRSGRKRPAASFPPDRAHPARLDPTGVSGTGFDEAVAAQLAKDIATAQELAPADSALGKSLKPPCSHRSPACPATSSPW
jgi:hypothetical protein